MKRFRVQINSNIRAVTISAVLLIPTLYLTAQINPDVGPLVSTIIFGLAVVGILYVSDYLSKATIEIQLSSESFKHIWKKRFLFNKTPSFEIKWNQVTSYTFLEDRNTDTFELFLNNGNRYKISRFTLFKKKDDFNKFTHQLPKFLAKLNKDGFASIEKGKNDASFCRFKKNGS